MGLDVWVPVYPVADRPARSVSTNLNRGVEAPRGLVLIEIWRTIMAGKNKGGREIKKPKQAKKPAAEVVTAVPKVVAGSKRSK